MAEVTVTYTGPHSAVDLPLPSGRVVVVKRGASIAVPAEVAASLTQQTGNWKAAEPKPANAKKER